jgi:multiple sugar transport system ATP-binding protein
LDRKPQALSGGQRQRVALGRAIVRQPRVFLFDEPLSNLDAKMRLQMRAELIQLHRRLGATMIYVTHDQAEAMTMGDRIAVMNEGEILQVDEPMSIYRKPANQFVAGFMGSPPMNFIPGHLDRVRETWVFRASQITDSSPAEPWFIEMPAVEPDGLEEWAGRELMAGLRPEELRVSRSSNDRRSKTKGHGRLELVETLGAEAYLHLNVSGHRLVARIMEPGGLRVDDLIEVQWDESKMHFFEPNSGRRITQSSAAATDPNERGNHEGH